MSNYVCSSCGTEAGEDTRIGSTSHYLACKCVTKGHWIDDGRGGYWLPSNGASPVPLTEYLKKQN